MKNALFLTFIFTGLYLNSRAQDTIPYVVKHQLNFSGQLSGWGLNNTDNHLPINLGARYIPTINYAIKQPSTRQFDFEISGNGFGTLGFHPFDQSHTDVTLSAYRVWARYSTKHLELRAGLQKINFGSATLLRPLMWFDQLDPRDPLQLTNGVWGVLGRYYFMNNANLWLWTLFGNQKLRPWDSGKTNPSYPEYGGRIQLPIPKGETAITYHHRVTDSRGLNEVFSGNHAVAENRIGIDGKWDLGVGLWFEGTFINKTKETGTFTNSELLNIGSDNTFENGLNLVFEQLLVAYDQNAFAFSRPTTFSGLSLSYPLSLIDNLNVISFYDWNTNSSYNFLNLKRQFNIITLYIMAFWNPRNYQLPQQLNSGNYYSGKGIQLMLVFNH